MPLVPIYWLYIVGMICVFILSSFFATVLGGTADKKLLRVGIMFTESLFWPLVIGYCLGLLLWSFVQEISHSLFRK